MGIESIVALIGTVVGAGVSAMGSMAQARAQKQAADYQAAVARNNAIVQQQNATTARQAGAIEAQTASQKAAAIQGSLRAGAAASGLDVNEGSPLDMQSSAHMLGMQDTLTTKYKGEAQAAAYEAQGRNDTAQAQLYTMQGAAAQQAGTFGAMSSLLSGATSFASKWNSFSNAGVGSSSMGWYDN